MYKFYIFYILVGLFVTIVNGNFAGCNSEQEDVIDKVQFEAESYVYNAYDYLEFTEHVGPLYQTWFGDVTKERINNLTNRYSNIRDQSINYIYTCNNCTSSNNKLGYVNPSDFGPIYLCEQFWTLPDNGTDSQAMTIIELASQFDKNGGAKIYTTGQENCKQLAKTNPDQAIDNAANLAYFAVNAPPIK